MARTFRTEVVYPCDAAAAFAQMCDPAYLEFLIANSGGVDPHVAVTDSADAVVITLDRALPADIPSYAKALVGEQLVVREERRWGPADADGTRTGSVSVTFDGAPARISGELRLSDSPYGACQEVSGSVNASIPLIGGKIEEFARGQLLRFTARETELAAQWASER